MPVHESDGMVDPVLIQTAQNNGVMGQIETRSIITIIYIPLLGGYDYDGPLN